MCIFYVLICHLVFTLIQNAEHQSDWTDFLTWVALVELTELGRFRGKKSLNVDWGTRSSSTGLRCQVTNGAPGQSSAKNGLLINQRSACRLSPDCLHPEWQPSDGTLNAKPRSTRLFLLVRITVAAMLITSENMRAQCRDIFVLQFRFIITTEESWNSWIKDSILKFSLCTYYFKHVTFMF